MWCSTGEHRDLLTALGRLRISPPVGRKSKPPPKTSAYLIGGGLRPSAQISRIHHLSAALDLDTSSTLHLALPHGREQKRKITRKREKSQSHVRCRQFRSGRLLVGAVSLLAVPRRPNHAVKPGGSLAPYVAYLEVTQREIWNRWIGPVNNGAFRKHH